MLDTIRIAVPADAARIAALVNAAYRPDADASGWTHEALLVDGDRTDTEQIVALIARARRPDADRTSARQHGCLH